VLVVQQNVVHPAIPSSSRAPYSLAASSFTAPSQALAIVWKLALSLSRSNEFLNSLYITLGSDLTWFS